MPSARSHTVERPEGTNGIHENSPHDLITSQSPSFYSHCIEDWASTGEFGAWGCGGRTTSDYSGNWSDRWNSPALVFITCLCRTDAPDLVVSQMKRAVLEDTSRVRHGLV